MRTIGNHMIKGPFVTDVKTGLGEAYEIMRTNQIRHLPVTDGDRLVGLVSERDLREFMNLPQARQMKVSEIMKKDIFVARRNTPLRDIIQTMEEQKIGSVVVINDQKECLGIFTTIDALGILADLLEDEDEEANLILLEDYIDLWKNPAASYF